MIDINLIRENKELVKENIKKKFQDNKLPIVDEVYELDKRYREAKKEADNLRAEKNKLSDQIGLLMREGKKEEALEIKETIGEKSRRIIELEKEEEELSEQVKTKMMIIPNIIDESVPVGRDDSENVVQSLQLYPILCKPMLQS